MRRRTRRPGIAVTVPDDALAQAELVRAGETSPLELVDEAIARIDGPQALAALREAGRPVFVDMTAAWCVTCLLNERVAIDTQAVRRAFQERNVVYLKGDWTRQDPALTAFLRENGRDGVPLYLFYPARAEAPVVLPQVLTAGTVLAALGERG